MPDIEKKLLHCVGRAIHDYRLIQHQDRILVCVSGGKDSLVLLQLLRLLQRRVHLTFDLFVLTIDQGFSEWDDIPLRRWLIDYRIPYEILKCDTVSIIRSKISAQKNYCSFCSRLRRGIIYSYARTHGFKKIALGHHRDDLITSLLMSILYSGEIRSMPPKLLTKTRQQIVIRPLVYCQEKDLLTYAEKKGLPYRSNNCDQKANTTRPRIQALIQELAQKNMKVPSNMLHALQNVKVSQLMDKRQWNFEGLEENLSEYLI